MFHQWGMDFGSPMCILSLTSMCEPPFLNMPAVFGKLVTNCYQTTDGSFLFFILPNHKAVFFLPGYTAERPSQGRAFNCFFAGGSSWQCFTSFLVWKKKRKILKTAEKGFLPMLDLPCGVCQTKEDPLIWSQQGPSTILGTERFWQEKSALPLMSQKSCLTSQSSWT